VCRAVGLQVDGESVPYVAGWGEGGALDAALEKFGADGAPWSESRGARR
jgi:hypothetical protein